MADKQLARVGTADFDILADDDPLAELARIVGYDNRPAVQQLQELEKHREMVRKEPVLETHAFDLEDELLREFDAYDAPHVSPAFDTRQQAGSDVPVDFVTPADDESDPAPVASAEPAMAGYQAVEHPAEEWLSEPAADAVSPAAEIERPVFEKPVFEERVVAEADAFEANPQDEPDAGSWPHEPEPAAQPADDGQADDGWTVEHWNEHVFDGADLERELELSIGYEETPVAGPEAEARSVQAPWFVEGLDVGIAATPVVALGDVDISSTPVESAGDDHFEIGQPAAIASMSDVQTHNDFPETQPEPALLPGSVAISARDPHGLDALLADIERFPVPAKAVVAQASLPETVRKVNYPFTPTFSRATPVASNSGVLSQKAFATPIPAAAVPLPLPAALTETAYQAAEVTVEPVVIEAASAVKAPVDEEPDFDLESFEMDLSGINLDIDPLKLDVAEEQPAFAPAPVKPSAAEPIIVAPAAPVFEVSQIEEPVSEEPESVLPFDPSMIAETEESLTAISDLNVPHLPVVEQERHIAHQPDYDLDIDAEMAQLFGTPNRGSRTADPSAVDGHGFASPDRAAVSAQPSGGAASAEDDFDEFEKAMEEDFRKSLSQRHEPDPAADRLAVGAGYSGNEDYDDEQRSPRKRRLLLLAATVAGLAIFGGAGVYAFMGGDASALPGGEPKIIMADKTPVKIVPVDKGGKTVPNQDKAVYDRVAGAQDTAPEQGTLVSSTEEPIDVVQRTLTPENLPLEGQSDSELPGVTPLDDDGSDRLMPDEQTADNAAAVDNETPAVSPRKVRTMIVKPDGTLVARDEPVAAVETNVASADISAKPGDPEIKLVKTTAVTPQAQTVSTPETLPVVEQVAEDGQKSALAEAADATVEEIAPVRSVRTTAVADNNPVPQTRPVEEPVKIVDTFKTNPAAAQPVSEVKPVVGAKPAAEAKPVETASIAPGTYVIQIASLPSEAEARKSYTTLSGKFGSVIGGKGVDIKRAEIAGKGTYFRVRIPAGTRDAANSLCSRYKTAGGSCLVTK